MKRQERVILSLTKYVPASDLKERREKALADYGSGDLSRIGECGFSCAVRTAQWIPKIEHFHRGGAFIIIGVGHVGGKLGALHLLERRGFDIEQVDSIEKFERLLKESK